MTDSRPSTTPRIWSVQARTICYGNSPKYGKAYHASHANNIQWRNKLDLKVDGFFVCVRGTHLSPEKRA